MPEEISMEDKFNLLQRLLSPPIGEITQQPFVLALKPFDPEKVKEIQVIGSWGNTSQLTATDNQTGNRTYYTDVHGVNYLVREQGWKVVAMLLVSREKERGQVVQDLITVLVLPKS